jgi:hypothetical protein
MVRRFLAAGVLGACAVSASAGEIYAGVGLPGVMLGYAQPLNDSFTLRGDWATLGSRNKRVTEEGITYDAKLAFNRLGLFADWFFLGGMRVTAGVTFNNLTADFRTQGDGTTAYQFGNNPPVVLTNTDQLTVTIKYPNTTPYLGLGYGHQASSGWGFTFDLGASYGKATLSESHSGPTLTNPALVSQASIDQEMAQLREGVGKVRYIPQLSFGVNYRF